MPKSQINVRLDDEIVERLDALARKTDRTKTFYAVEAIHQFLEDREDYLLAKDSLEAFEAFEAFEALGEGMLTLEDIDWGSEPR